MFCTSLVCASLLGLLPIGASATPLISEFFYDAVGSDDGHTFVELYGEPGGSLDGLNLTGVNGAGGGLGPVISLSGVFPEDGLFVLADRSAEGGSFVVGWDLLANFDFQNGPDSVQLRAGAVVLDALGYGVFGESLVFAGEGQAAPDAPAGSSLARHFANLDTNDNSADFLILGVPTPGAAALSEIPEPGTASLVLIGLFGLAALGRRPR
ncbi:MAG: PEP-CTERM sorting domain-containing protein [Myxococcota bacterium]